MKTKFNILASVVALFLGFLTVSCDNYDDDMPVAPDAGNTEVNGNEGLYMGHLKVAYLPQDADNTSQLVEETSTVLIFVSNQGNDNLKFSIYPMSFYNVHWYTPTMISEFSRHLTYDNDKLVGDDISIRGATLEFHRVFSTPEVRSDRKVYREEFFGFKQANSHARVEYSPVGQYKGKFYTTSLSIDNDEEFNALSEMIENGIDPDQFVWNEQPSYTNITMSGGEAKLTTGQTVAECKCNLKFEVFTRDLSSPIYYVSLWKGSGAVSSKEENWSEPLDAAGNFCFKANGAVVSSDGKVYLKKTYTITHNPEKEVEGQDEKEYVEGGTITGIAFDGTKSVPTDIVEIILAPKD